MRPTWLWKMTPTKLCPKMMKTQRTWTSRRRWAPAHARLTADLLAQLKFQNLNFSLAISTLMSVRRKRRPSVAAFQTDAALARVARAEKERLKQQAKAKREVLERMRMEQANQAAAGEARKHCFVAGKALDRVARYGCWACCRLVLLCYHSAPSLTTYARTSSCCCRVT
jgi:hypothetical protein